MIGNVILQYYNRHITNDIMSCVWCHMMQRYFIKTRFTRHIIYKEKKWKYYLKYAHSPFKHLSSLYQPVLIRSPNWWSMISCSTWLVEHDVRADINFTREFWYLFEEILLHYFLGTSVETCDWMTMMSCGSWLVYPVHDSWFVGEVGERINNSLGDWWLTSVETWWMMMIPSYMWLMDGFNSN